MVDTIKISALPTEISPTSDDIVPMVDGATSATKNVAFDEFGKAINYTNSLSTDANNLLAVDGSNKLNLTASGELVSSDASNTISVGTDGKLYGSATALTLNENELFVGNASNQPVSTSANDVRQVLGLPTDYIKDDIQYISSNQVSWEGKCRDSSDSRDFELGSATTASLVGATANTTYNLFVAGNTLTDTPVVVWDSGSIPSGYTYYRLIFSIKVDGLGNIPSFTTSDTLNRIYIYTEPTTSFNGTPSTTPTDITLDFIPEGFEVRPILRFRGTHTASNSFKVRSKNNSSIEQVIGTTTSDGEIFTNTIELFSTDINGVIQVFADSSVGNLLVGVNGFIMER